MDILLLKLKKGRFYVRKNALNYITTDLFAIVSPYDEVVAYAFWGKGNGIYIAKKDVSNKRLIRLIKKENINKMTDKDRYCIYWIKNKIKLNNKVSLSKKVNGLRYATQNECENIIDSIVLDLIKQENLCFKDILYNTPKYAKLYSYCMENDFEGSLFKLIREEGVLNELH